MLRILFITLLMVSCSKVVDVPSNIDISAPDTEHRIGVGIDFDYVKQYCIAQVEHNIAKCHKTGLDCSEMIQDKEYLADECFYSFDFNAVNDLLGALGDIN